MLTSGAKKEVNKMDICEYCGTEDDVRPFIKEDYFGKQEIYACIQCGQKIIKKRAFIKGCLMSLWLLPVLIIISVVAYKLGGT